MKLEKFKEKDRKKIGVIVFTLLCVFLVVGVIIYRTFAIFEVKTNQNIINGNVQSGDILFTFYKKDENGNYVITDTLPNGEYSLNSSDSYCGVAGTRDEGITVSMDSTQTLEITGLSSPSTKCKLYFEKWEDPFANPKETVDETTGSGLYEVKHDDLTSDSEDEGGILASDLAGWKKTEWRYGGPAPNNYVTFNNEVAGWRIIGLVNVKTESGITQRIKIIKDKALEGTTVWDSGNKNDWTKASLMTELNGNYYQNTLTDTASKGMIAEDIIWNIGGWSTNIVRTAAMYGYERGTKTENNNEYPNEWDKDNTVEGIEYHSIGLMYPSDYGYAVGGASRSCIEGTNLGSYNTCKTNNWLALGSNEWTLSPYSSHSNLAFIVDSSGYVINGNVVYASYAVRPVVYLSSKVSITDGKGTESEPYVLTSEE